MHEVIVKKGRERSILRRHPWVFNNSVDEIKGCPTAGDLVRLVSRKGEFLAWGAYSPASNIRIRIWSWDEESKIDRSFFKEKLSKSILYRNKLVGLEYSNAVRLVNAESDGLPGFILDKYQDLLVFQCLSAGPEHWREVLIELIHELTGINKIFERSDGEVRKLEGLPKRNVAVQGALPDLIQISESGINYYVNINSGHKTGFYIDQRSNREIFRRYVNGLDVLDCFCYTGGFAINALVGGAKSITAIDSSSEVLITAAENLKLNKFQNKPISWIKADVFQRLRRFRDEGKRFDLIVLDPPKFAPTPASKERAARGYKDINLLAFKLLREGGFLFTFSCSGGIDQVFFQKIVADAALDAGVETRIVQRLYQSADHVVSLNFPEGMYLKGLVIKVTG